jgi:hypothetical protein
MSGKFGNMPGLGNMMSRMPGLGRIPGFNMSSLLSKFPGGAALGPLGTALQISGLMKKIPGLGFMPDTGDVMKGAKKVGKKIGGWAKKGIGKIFSDENIKDGVFDVAPGDVLSRLKAMPISSWQYKGEDARHIGPMAQDFHKTFGLGSSDRTIDVVDAVGVNMSASKALAKQLDDLQKEVSLLKQRRARR